MTDRSDPKLVHLDGLNLNRAWCIRGIAAVLLPDDPVRPLLESSSSGHAQAALGYVASGNYLGEH